jgi:hypothetical protein
MAELDPIAFNTPERAIGGLDPHQEGFTHRHL